MRCIQDAVADSIREVAIDSTVALFDEARMGLGTEWRTIGLNADQYPYGNHKYGQ